jgi:NADH-quinone oxidoreductase subunit G
MIVKRGAHEEIDVFPGYPLANKMAGNVVDLCPVGALADRDFLYKQRVWFMTGHSNVCAGCSTGCSIRVEENQDRIYRVKPRENPYINRWWMCDEGRYGWRHVHDPRRLVAAKRYEDGQYRNVEWSELTEELDQKLRCAERPAAVLSPHLTVEEAYLLATYIRGIKPKALLAMGPVPVRGQDESFPGGLTIRAEKCPNRRGVEEILGRLAGKLVTWDEFLRRIDQNEFDAVWISGGYKKDWNDQATAERFARVALLVVQDTFASPLLSRATYQLPAATFAEREGSYVNRFDRLQSFRWAIRPPAGVMVEGQLYWRLLGRPGLYQARRVLDDLAREILYFSAAVRPVPEVGLDLKMNWLASI